MDLREQRDNEIRNDAQRLNIGYEVLDLTTYSWSPVDIIKVFDSVTSLYGKRNGEKAIKALAVGDVVETDLGYIRYVDYRR